MAEHYGCLIDPARAAKPKDKPRVERVMQYVRDSFWRGRSFASLTDMQTRAISWCREVAGVRAHRSLDGASPLAVFDALEAPALLALPARPKPKQSKLFFAQLDVGHRYVLLVGAGLLSSGLTVRVPPSERREGVEDRHQWQWDVDLYVRQYQINAVHQAPTAPRAGQGANGDRAGPAAGAGRVAVSAAARHEAGRPAF
jgi:hypothetical protein